MDIDIFLEQQQQEFRNFIKKGPFFRIVAAVVPFTDEFINTNDADFRKLLSDPPNQRKDGWSLAGPHTLRPTLEGIATEGEWRHFELWRMGYLSFYTPVDENFCWRYKEFGEENPILLYPYAVIEYPYSFFIFMREIYNYLNLKYPELISAISNFRVELGFYNCNGFKLHPGHPRSIGYSFDFEAGVRYAQDLIIPRSTISKDFQPGKEARRLIARIYNAFGLEESTIPLIDADGNFKPV